MKILIPSILALLVVLGAPSVAFATSSVPFNGSVSGSFTIISATTVAIIGTGHLEHLGKTMIAGTSANTGTSACGGFTTTERDTFTAANGDEVFISSSDVFCPTSNPLVLQLTGSTTVTGGTGRFADASGSGTIQASIVLTSMTSGTFSGTSTGTITY